MKTKTKPYVSPLTEAEFLDLWKRETAALHKWQRTEHPHDYDEWRALDKCFNIAMKDKRLFRVWAAEVGFAAPVTTPPE